MWGWEQVTPSSNVSRLFDNILMVIAGLVLVLFKGQLVDSPLQNELGQGSRRMGTWEVGPIPHPPCSGQFWHTLSSQQRPNSVAQQT